ncbi:MAG: undecaprenyldiphospho-muramoylpentapeptide beta-N-acetylglucosaminyltransferase [Firmicutes bacterium]|nr:undecaprenyldiphospho-muramoylpentapeptide beta-N-acetylglucosaminyltransferase [Bacillota bacterium]
METKHLRVILTGGGTGGHVTPNMALIPYLQERGHEVIYIGSEDGMERRLIGEMKIPYYGIDSERLNRYFTVENLTMPFHVLRGIRQAKRLIRELKPDVVFSKGGFVSVPVVIAAHRYHVPVVCHESDITPGLANKLSVPFATKVCVNFPEALDKIRHGKGVYTGTPIRDSLLAGSREQGLAISGLSGTKPILLVMGGSTGAKALNDGIREALPKVLPEFEVLHLCGKGNADPSLEGTPGYYQIEYANEEMPHFYAAADLTMCRAGANSLAEILALRLPNVLVPLPLSASRGDQILNAASFTGKGFSLTLEQEKMNPETILASAREVYQHRDQYREAMQRDPGQNGNLRVLEIIEQAALQDKEK